VATYEPREEKVQEAVKEDVPSPLEHEEESPPEDDEDQRQQDSEEDVSSPRERIPGNAPVTQEETEAQEDRQDPNGTRALPTQVQESIEATIAMESTDQASRSIDEREEEKEVEETSMIPSPEEGKQKPRAKMKITASCLLIQGKDRAEEAWTEVEKGLGFDRCHFSLVPSGTNYLSREGQIAEGVQLFEAGPRLLEGSPTRLKPPPVPIRRGVIDEGETRGEKRMAQRRRSRGGEFSNHWDSGACHWASGGGELGMDRRSQRRSSISEARSAPPTTAVPSTHFDPPPPTIPMNMTVAVAFQSPRMEETFRRGCFSCDETEERIIQRAQRESRIFGVWRRLNFWEDHEGIRIVVTNNPEVQSSPEVQREDS
jgi:hypothetical protein